LLFSLKEKNKNSKIGSSRNNSLFLNAQENLFKFVKLRHVYCQQYLTEVEPISSSSVHLKIPHTFFSDKRKTIANSV